jgi:hypothetical protein
MKRVGREGAIVKDDKPGWFVGTETMEIPLIKKITGKTMRVDFNTYGNLQELAQEIMEHARHKYKTTTDVHRNAHYIGMYILKQRDVVNSQYEDIDAVIAVTAPMLMKSSKKKMLREQFMKVFDDFSEDVVSEEALQESISGILAQLDGDEESKEWMMKDIEKILNDESIYGKTKHKTYMRQWRANKAGLRVLENGG